MDSMDDIYCSEQYNEYLTNHIHNVRRGYEWIKINIPSLIPEEYVDDIEYCINNHDKSKTSKEEYKPYANYFYGNKTPEAKEAFDYAWLHHIRHNPHHWQYWVLINDEDGTKALDMPYPCIIEMFCDHWAFSWGKHNLNEIFDWYRSHKSTMILSEYTRSIYEIVLNAVKMTLQARPVTDFSEISL